MFRTEEWHWIRNISSKICYTIILSLNASSKKRKKMESAQYLRLNDFEFFVHACKCVLYSLDYKIKY